MGSLKEDFYSMVAIIVIAGIASSIAVVLKVSLLEVLVVGFLLAFLLVMIAALWVTFVTALRNKNKQEK